MICLPKKVVGDVMKMTANLNYPLLNKERIVKLELAGGALLDVGIYPLNFAYIALWRSCKRNTFRCTDDERWCRWRNGILLLYEDGRMAVLNSGIHGKSDSQGVFYGSEGCMIVENINNPEVIKIYDKDRNPIREVKVPEQISGYEYEIAETISCIKEGKLECPSMPHAETLTDDAGLWMSFVAALPSFLPESIL